MKRILELSPKTTVILFVFLDVIAAGMGMGVPIFCILFGFPLGWYIATRTIHSGHYPQSSIPSIILKHAIWSAAFTLLIMLVIWGRPIAFLFNPAYDFKNFGHPFILYDPKMSFIGWLVLMIIISPFLQLLTTVFMAFLVLVKKHDIPTPSNHQAE
ncbi:MAG: hypothetical protein KBA26_09260 [Candidatus Delongbacteria bacterium]|nr:hypothetical protein [Candidatus Delongbacteria bacterium]